MIEASIEGNPAAGLARRAARIAAARAESRIRAATRDPWRWREPRLLWPDFAKD